MLLELKHGRVYDPTHGIDGEPRTLHVRNGRLCAPPRTARPDQVYNLRGLVVMPGGIDPHTHMAGGKSNLGRLLLHEDHRDHPVAGGRLTRPGSGHVVPTAALTGYRYAALGYTTCFEPAMLPANARQVHLEFGDMPIIDKGCYVLLGNDDVLLETLAASRHPGQAIRDYVAWMVAATRAQAVKIVNPGGINAFKYNQRSLDLDERNRGYGLSPRHILVELARAVHELGLPHPLHIHGCNLGAPGSVDTSLRTITALEGIPAHLTHLQFHAYGNAGKRGFSPGGHQLAAAVNNHPNLTIDAGQLMFGQTLTASGDTMHQYAAREHARPRRMICMDIECEAGCGVLPFRYREASFVNALQWAVGLQLYLLIDDPWRIFMTTDHPNGGPFTVYPKLIRLLMDRSFREQQLAEIHPEAAAMSELRGLQREYSLYEIAIITRAGPARSLGLQDRGHLGRGAVADIAVYRPQRDAERMFSAPEYVFKNGQLVARRGRIVALRDGQLLEALPDGMPKLSRPLERRYNDSHAGAAHNFPISNDELAEINSQAGIC